jgi:hypothetical protein
LPKQKLLSLSGSAGRAQRAYWFDFGLWSPLANPKKLRLNFDSEMKSCPHCGAEYADEVISCPVDHHPVGARGPRSQFTTPRWLRIPRWLSSFIKWYRSQPRKRKLKLAVLGFVTVLAVYILSTSEYSYYNGFGGAGIFRISKPPLFTITMGATATWHVQSGINFVPAQGLVEFPIFPGYRIGISYFTFAWWHRWRQYHSSS